jgi:hypothetical protein
MKKITDRILTAIFCDDIRQELGNKMSFMGCYHGELHVASTPISLSKLCVYATVLTPLDRPFKLLTLRLVLDDQIELARLEVSADALTGHSEHQDQTATRKGFSTALMFSPFFIEKPTSLRLMADTEEGEIVGPRLLIKVVLPTDSVLTTTGESNSDIPQTAKKKLARKKAASIA